MFPLQKPPEQTVTTHKGSRVGYAIVIVILCVLYTLSPLDFDFIPAIGWLDDLAVDAGGIVLTIYQLWKFLRGESVWQTRK